MDKKTLCLAGLVTVAFGLFIWLSQVQHRAEQLQSVNVYSRNNKSLSLLREWKQTALGQSVVVNNKAFLFGDELGEFDGILIASPRLQISTKEAKVLTEYMRQGGRLLVSAHDQTTYANLGALWKQVGFDHAIQDMPNFANREVVPATTDEQASLFEPGQSYGFYSLIQFAGLRCQSNSLACFAQEIEVEQGNMVVTLGLPLPGNAMISHHHNIDFTLAFGQWAP